MDYSEPLTFILHDEQVNSSDRNMRAVITVIAYVFIFWLALPASLFATGFRLDELVPVRGALSDEMIFPGWGMVLFGAAFMLAGSGQLWFQGKGLPISHLPPTEFVVKGIYRHLRHPIYVGYTVAFAGASLVVGSFWSLTVSSTLLLLCWIGYALFYEEPTLALRFGKRYGEYQKTTALLLPKKLTNALTRVLRAVSRALRRPLSRIANWTIIFRRGRLILVTYGAFVTLGSFLFMLWTSSLLIAEGVEVRHVAVFLVGSVLSVIFFARLFWWLGNIRAMLRHPLFGVRGIGFVSFGAFAALIFCATIFGRYYDYPVLMIMDAILRGTFVGAALGRIGCLTYGCCYGIRSKPYGILYTDPHAKVIRECGTPLVLRHPTQAYSFIKNLSLFILLNLIAYKALPAGFITAAAFLLYPLARTFIEFLRDRRRYLRGIFTDGHLSSAVMFALGWLILFYIPPVVDAASPQPLTAEAMRDAMQMLPLILSLSVLASIATSLHWKRVGTL